MLLWGTFLIKLSESMKPPSIRQHILVGAQKDVEEENCFSPLGPGSHWQVHPSSSRSIPALIIEVTCSEFQSRMKIAALQESSRPSTPGGDSGDEDFISDSPPLLCGTTIVGLLHHTEEDKLNNSSFNTCTYTYICDILTFKIHMLHTWMNIYYYIWIYTLYIHSMSSIPLENLTNTSTDVL